MKWPNDFDGAHHIGPATKPMIYESPDKGKTIYAREFGADPRNRIVVKTAVQQQWNITYKGMKV